MNSGDTKSEGRGHPSAGSGPRAKSRGEPEDRRQKHIKNEETKPECPLESTKLFSSEGRRAKLLEKIDLGTRRVCKLLKTKEWHGLALATAHQAYRAYNLSHAGDASAENFQVRAGLLTPLFVKSTKDALNLLHTVRFPPAPRSTPLRQPTQQIQYGAQ